MEEPACPGAPASTTACRDPDLHSDAAGCVAKSVLQLHRCIVQQESLLITAAIGHSKLFRQRGGLQAARRHVWEQSDSELAGSGNGPNRNITYPAVTGSLGWT